MGIDNLASTTVVLGFAGGVFSYVVLKPLHHAIEKLDKAIGELRLELLAAEGRRHELEVLVAKIEQSARSAHHRIDRLEGVVGNVGHE